MIRDSDDDGDSYDDGNDVGGGGCYQKVPIIHPNFKTLDCPRNPRLPGNYP